MRWFSKIDKKIFTYVLWISLIVFILIACTPWDNFFTENIIPELIGVCIELLIMLHIFNYWQEKSKLNKLVTLEKRLREYLIFFLNHSFQSLPKEIRIGRFYGQDHQTNIDSLDKIINYINDIGLNSINIEAIKSHCDREASTLSNLLPVASELTNAHFKAWCRIVHFVEKISKLQEDNAESSIIKILQQIKKFDTASFELKLYPEEINAKQKCDNKNTHKDVSNQSKS